MQQFQGSSGWDVDLQNLYNVGFDQGRSSNAFSSQPYTGKDKIETMQSILLPLVLAIMTGERKFREIKKVDISKLID